jgi:hypothetical protein
MQRPEERSRQGYFAATGSYVWFAFSDGKDPQSDIYPTLDLRRKVTPVMHYKFVFSLNI